MRADKIFLIGFMGCGKSTFGRKLAKNLSWDFVDLDDFIETKEGKSIANIFSEKGEGYFRELESEVLQLTKSWTKTVVSCGGGTPCFNGNDKQINELGLSIYIKLSPEVLCDRLVGEKSKRPLIADLSNEQLLNFVNNKLIERSSAYENAQIVFDYADEKEKSFIKEIRERIIV